MLLDMIKADLKKAMMMRDEDKKNTLRLILGEVPRLNKKANETITDGEIEGIIRKLIKSETIVLEASNSDKNESIYIQTLEGYLPQMMPFLDIINWVVNNIEIDNYDPKIKAMGVIMKQLKGKADGKMVRQVLESM